MTTPADDSTPVPSLLGLPLRVGRLLASPREAFARVERDGGALRDGVALAIAGAVAFRFPELVQGVLGVLGPTSGAFMRLVAVLAAEIKEAAFMVIPAAVAVTVLAGARRDASRDLELAAACYPAFFLVRALVRAADAVAGARVFPARVTLVAAGVVTLPLVILAIRIARARTPAPAGDVQVEAAAPGPAPAGGVARAGALALVLFGLVGLGGGVLWTARHIDALRPMERGQGAPTFTLPRINGSEPGSVSMDSLRGQVVVLDFWATWCPPCIAMLPVMESVHATWAPRGVAFVGINSDGGGASFEDIKGFMVEHPAPYPVVIDDGHVGGLYRVEALPSLIVVGRDGRIRGSFVGYTSEATIAKALREALDAKTDPGT